MATNPVQSTYTATIAAGFPGMVADGETSNRISRTVEDAAGIAFGKAAFRGAGDHGVSATPVAGKFMGVTIADVSVQPVPGGVAADIYPQYATAGLLRSGKIWVVAGVNVADGDQVYVTAAGVFTNVVGANILIPAEFDDTVSAAAMVRLRVRPSAV